MRAIPTRAVPAPSTALLASTATVATAAVLTLIPHELLDQATTLLLLVLDL